MTALSDSASVHERTVQAVAAAKDLGVPRSRVKTPRGSKRGGNTRTEVMRVDRQVWEAVKKVVRPGHVIVIVSEHEVWLRNKPS